MRHLLTAASLLALLIACPAPTTSNDGPVVPSTPAPPSDPPPASDPPPPAKAADGAACTAAGDCASGVCEGQGCEVGQGTCAAASRACTRDLVTYCGCDGNTFQASGSCPGARYAQRGECAPPPAPQKAADGASCNEHGDCDSGICEGEGCGAGGGKCAAKNRACTKDLRSYCGCDGKTFKSSGSCPGQRYSAKGACPAK